MPQYSFEMKGLRADLAGASGAFLVYAEMNIGITAEETAVICKMITAQMNLIEDLAFIRAADIY